MRKRPFVEMSHLSAHQTPPIRGVNRRGSPETRMLEFLARHMALLTTVHLLELHWGNLAMGSSGGHARVRRQMGQGPPAWESCYPSHPGTIRTTRSSTSDEHLRLSSRLRALEGWSLHQTRGGSRWNNAVGSSLAPTDAADIQRDLSSRSRSMSRRTCSHDSL